jgi:hypothetical protein
MNISRQWNPPPPVLLRAMLRTTYSRTRRCLFACLSYFWDEGTKIPSENSHLEVLILEKRDIARTHARRDMYLSSLLRCCGRVPLGGSGFVTLCTTCFSLFQSAHRMDNGLITRLPTHSHAGWLRTNTADVDWFITPLMGQIPLSQNWAENIPFPLLPTC